MTHRPQSLDDCAPNAKALPHKHVPAKAGIRRATCKTTLANSRLLPIAKADGFYGLSDKKRHVKKEQDSLDYPSMSAETLSKRACVSGAFSRNAGASKIAAH